VLVHLLAAVELAALRGHIAPRARGLPLLLGLALQRGRHGLHAEGVGRLRVERVLAAAVDVQVLVLVLKAVPAGHAPVVHLRPLEALAGSRVRDLGLNLGLGGRVRDLPDLGAPADGEDVGLLALANQGLADGDAVATALGAALRRRVAGSRQVVRHDHHLLDVRAGLAGEAEEILRHQLAERIPLALLAHLVRDVLVHLLAAVELVAL